PAAGAVRHASDGQRRPRWPPEGAESLVPLGALATLPSPLGSECPSLCPQGGNARRGGPSHPGHLERSGRGGRQSQTGESRQSLCPAGSGIGEVDGGESGGGLHGLPIPEGNLEEAENLESIGEDKPGGQATHASCQPVPE